MLPSAALEDLGRDRPLVTASRSHSMPLAKERRCGEVVGFDGGEPALQMGCCGALGHHLGEGGDVLVECGQAGAAVPDGRELVLFVVSEVVGLGDRDDGLALPEEFVDGGVMFAGTDRRA